MSVAAGDEIAGDLVGRAVPHVADHGPLAVDILQADIGDLEMQRQSGGEPRGDQILHHLVLAVDRDRLAGERAEVDAMVAAGEADLDSRVDEAFAPHPLAEAGRVKELDGALLEHAGPDAAFHIGARAVLEDDGIDAAAGQQTGKEQSRRSRAHDAHLRAMLHGSLRPSEGDAGGDASAHPEWRWRRRSANTGPDTQPCQDGRSKVWRQTSCRDDSRSPLGRPGAPRTNPVATARSGLGPSRTGSVSTCGGRRTPRSAPSPGIPA